MRRRTLGMSMVAAAAVSLLPLGSASAEPSTVVSYPAGATATSFAGRGFDACEAPSLGAIQAWTASPYRALATYIGGRNRTCQQQPNLTASWVSSVARLGWRVIPLYVGYQAPCSDDAGLVRMTAGGSTAQGQGEANNAVVLAKSLGIRPGSAIYYDLENYSALDSRCPVAVLQYVSGWVRELHRLGYLAGVYANLSSGAKDLSAAYPSAAYARPDAIWAARPDGVASLSGWPNVSSTAWTNHQRAKQYFFDGPNSETYGGVTINIDRDLFDGPTASVAFVQTVTATSGLNARSGPTHFYPVVRTYPHGAAVSVVCQAPGELIGTAAVWDRISDGSYASDFYLNTPSKTTYSAPIPRCRYPYQVTATPSLKRHTTPSTTAPSPGSLWSGALAWVTCQLPGTKVGTTAVWDKLDDTRYVADYYVATGKKGSVWTTPIPRC
jgi:hypothetical protein